MAEISSPSICRACLSDSGDFQSIFVPDDTTELSIHLSEMIMSFAAVQVTLGDDLPEQICKECAKDTVKFYLFKKKCEGSDRTLRERFRKSPYSLENPPIDIKDANEPLNDIEVMKPEFSAEHCDDDVIPERENDDSDFSDNTEEVPDFFENENGYQCEQCLRLFSRESALERHMKTHTAVKKHECNKKFSRHDLLLRHKIAHALKMDAKIEFEDYADDVEEESDTIIIKTESDLHPCSSCELIFLKKEELETHCQKEHPPKKKKISCSLCLKTFTKQAHLNRHLKIHSESKQLQCSTCNEIFVNRELLNHHMSNAHSGAKPHVCDTCLKGFNQISNLKDHMRTHNGEKPFLCATCGKGFNQLGNLRQHTVRHSGIKAHLCSTCGNGFASKGELSAHLRKHTGARPFVCTVCNHGFTTSSSLTKHKRIHSGEKPYECDVCRMKFSRSGILARHKRTHTGEKPYVCKYCAKAFSQSNDLTSHLRIHTGEKPYICDACGQAFRQSSALKTHKKTHVDKVERTEKKLFDSMPGTARVCTTEWGFIVKP